VESVASRRRRRGTFAKLHSDRVPFGTRFARENSGSRKSAGSVSKGSTGASRLREARGESSPRRLASEDQTGDRVFAPRRVRRDRVVSRSASEEARSSPSTSGLDPSVSLSDRSRCGDLRRDRTWRRLRGNRNFLRTGFCENDSSEELLRAGPQICHPSVAAGSGSERETERPWKGPGFGALAGASCLASALSGAR